MIKFSQDSRSAELKRMESLFAESENIFKRRAALLPASVSISTYFLYFFIQLLTLFFARTQMLLYLCGSGFSYHLLMSSPAGFL